MLTIPSPHESVIHPSYVQTPHFLLQSTARSQLLPQHLQSYIVAFMASRSHREQTSLFPTFPLEVVEMTPECCKNPSIGLLTLTCRYVYEATMLSFC